MSSPWQSAEVRMKLADLLIAMKTAPSADSAYSMICELSEMLGNMPIKYCELVEQVMIKTNAAEVGLDEG